MVGKEYEVGDLVWAQMKSYPPWPSRISEPPSGAKSPSKKPQHWVYFFGSENYAWIPDEKIFPNSEEMLQKAVKNKSAAFHKAVDEMVSESNGIPQKHIVQDKVDINSNVSSVIIPEKRKVLKIKKSMFRKNTFQKSKKITKKRPLVSNSSDRDISPKKEKKLKYDMTVSANKKLVAPLFEDDLIKNFPRQPSGMTKNRKYIDLPSAPAIDIKNMKESLKAKHVKPTSKKIGFLGLGSLGRGMVKNLIISGHDVTVWNRTPMKCTSFLEAGARKGQTPADVIQACDITFCCVSEPMATKTLVFGNCGVLRGLEGCAPGSKGYVEFTGIDPQTSQEIAKEICNKGGKYLEAPIHGSRSLAEEGELLIIAAGDQGLFQACESSFSAISKNAYFVSLDVGNACRMSIIISMFNGTVIGALAEALTMVNRCKLSLENFMNILEVGPASCQIVKEKGRAMQIEDFTTNTAVKHQQKDLALAITLGDSVNQPLKITAAAHEIYKRAKLLRYSEHDVSAVVQGTRY